MDASHDAMLKAACEQFLGKSTREIENIALETLVRKDAMIWVIFFYVCVL